MPSVNGLKNYDSQYPVKLTDTNIILNSDFWSVFVGRASLQFLKLDALSPSSNTTSAKGDVGCYFDNGYVSVPYTFRSSKAATWNSIPLTDQGKMVEADLAARKYLNVSLSTYTSWFYFARGEGYTDTNYIRWSIGFQFTNTQVSDIKIISGSNVRDNITIAWTSVIQDAFAAEIIQNGNTVYKFSGLSQKNITIPAGTLQAGNFTFRLLTANNPYENWGQTFTNDTIFNATSTYPSIASLEPNGVNQSVESPITVSWVSFLQDNYNINIYSNNNLIKTYTGTTAKQIVIPKETLPTGNIRLDLTISNTINGITLTANKQAAFLGYGKPTLPVFEDKSIFEQVKPLIKWSAQGQIAYKLDIYKDLNLIESSGEKNGSTCEYQVISNLNNNSFYNIKLKVKNQYDLWSEVASKDIRISYTVLPKPQITLNREEGGILVSIIYKNVSGLKNLEIWRRDKFSEYKRMGFDMKPDSQWVDNTVASGVEYTYKVLAVGTSGGVSESESQTEKAFVNAFFFEDIENNERKIFEINPQITIEDVVDKTVRVFAGAARPKIEKGKTNYRRLSADFTILSEEYEGIKRFFDKGRVILFRDLKGAKFYGAVTSPIPNNYLKGDKSAIKFTFEEVNYLEKDVVSDKRLNLTYWNGIWKWDGAIDWSGELLI